MFGAVALILYGFTGKFDDWKPPQTSALAGLDRIITALCAIGLIATWMFATPDNVIGYIHLAFWLVGICGFFFVIYVGLRILCGRYNRPLVDSKNRPNGSERIWGGFWLTPAAKKAYRKGTTISEFLAGNNYIEERVWPPLSQATSSMVAAVTLLAIVAGGASGLSTAATAAQVTLTKKPAREIFSSSDVPGLPSTSPSEK